MPHKPKREVVLKYNRKVDTGPLPDTSPAMRNTIQKERIRRQRASHIKPSPKGR